MSGETPHGPILIAGGGIGGLTAAALRRYEALRRRRTAGIVLRAYHLGWIGQWESAAACRLRDRLVAWTPGAFLPLKTEGPALA